MRAPAWLHDVVGEEPSAAEIAAILAFALPTATLALVFARPAVSSWRIAIAWLLLADIAAGCVANFTRSTNDFYAARPRNRWLFIAVHVHLPVFAWLVQSSATSASPLWPVALIWSFTIAAASMVNLLAGREAQVFVAGLSLAIGLAITAAVPTSTVIRVAGVLFLTKVAFSFAVDHFRSAVDRRESVRPLAAREHDEAVSIIARAFERDPLFMATCEDSARKRAALASFLLDMTRLAGGSVRARSHAGRIVAVTLVDAPAAQRPSAWRYALVFARFVPALFSLGVRSARRLNEYFVRTRATLSSDTAYLALLAVDPSAQGRGFGGEMIRDTLALASAMCAKAIGLDTENKQNVALYERYGFALDRELALDSMRVFVMSKAIDNGPTIPS